MNQAVVVGWRLRSGCLKSERLSGCVHDGRVFGLDEAGMALARYWTLVLRVWRHTWSVC